MEIDNANENTSIIMSDATPIISLYPDPTNCQDLQARIEKEREELAAMRRKNADDTFNPVAAYNIYSELGAIMGITRSLPDDKKRPIEQVYLELGVALGILSIEEVDTDGNT